MYVMNRKFQEMIMVSQTRNMIKLRLRYHEMKTWVIVIHQMVKNLKSKPKNDEIILTKDQSESYKWNINIITNLTLNVIQFLH